jgi:hypothetical protein
VILDYQLGGGGQAGRGGTESLGKDSETNGSVFCDKAMYKQKEQ